MSRVDKYPSCDPNNYRLLRADKLKAGDLIHHKTLPWKVISCVRKTNVKVALTLLPLFPLFKDVRGPVEERVMYDGANVALYTPPK